MLFACYLGQPYGLRAWQEAVRAHAHWLGLVPTLLEQSLLTGDALSVAWLAARSASSPELRADGATLRILPGGGPALGRNVITVSVDTRTALVRATAPLATPHALFHAAVDGGIVLSDDLRLFPLLAPAELDVAGVFGLLQYGAVPAPYTLFQGVRRVPGGHVADLGADGDVRLTRTYTPPTPLAEPATTAGDRLASALDAILGDLPSGSLLFFSGGTDSGLLAARLARLGRRDIRLFNYAFREDDPEGVLATRMARRLGFECEVARPSDDATSAMLERMGREYAYPFGDLSTVPTNHLVHAALGGADDVPVVVEGTGADGAFGLAIKYPWWRRVYGLPPGVRRAVAAAYTGIAAWQRDSVAERFARFVRKSVLMPLGQAVVAQNGLDGIVYTMPPQVRETLADAVRDTIDALAEGQSPEERLSLLDLVLVCGGRMAPKSFGPLKARGVSPVYPYLDPSVLEVSAALPWTVKCAGGEAKAPLKTLLARDVPADWVYRRKSGFTPPYHGLFASAPLQHLLHDVVLSSDNPLLDFVDRDAVEKLVAQTRPPHSLSDGALDFLWALGFASGWLLQQPAIARVEA